MQASPLITIKVGGEAEPQLGVSLCVSVMRL